MNGGANIRWAAQKAVRLGRPPTDLAAEVDLRISTAACELFLARELAGVSVEEIACRTSKATVYTRFPTKEALFAAIFHSKPGGFAFRT